MSSISGKSAFVTGGTKGIGLAIAGSLAARGAAVFLVARNAREVEHVVASLRAEHGDRIAGASCDVREYEQVRAAMQAMERAFGGIDFLINNAGVGYFANVEAMPVSDWAATMETNLSGVFYCCREAIPMMKQRGGGYIINIGSLAGKNAFAGGAAYNASKFGLIGFSEALMQDVRYNHIRVSYVMPGSVDTDFGHSGKQAPSKPWKLLPEDVARVVIDLLQMDPRALASRVEIRPSEPRK
ncbi:MAG TPA: SDR family oxidoreductase [Blastocatellia bacterium]|nr:SDR family oxidoreductase [Blastocatellia bacterium]